MRQLACVLIFCAVVSCRKQEPPPPAAAASPAAPVKPKPSPPLNVYEEEPDDFQHAMGVPPRTVIAGTLTPPRARVADEDWYRVEAVGKTLALRIDLRQVGDAPLDASLELYDRDRNRLLRVHAGGEDPGTIPAAACAGSCFVKVSGTVAAKYELTILGDDPVAGEELEPNDRAVDANELFPGKPMKGTFLAGDDEDWYRLNVAAVAPGQFLRIDVTGVAGVRPELEVRALSDGSLLASMRAAGAGEPLLVRDLSLHLGEKPVATPDAGVANEDAGMGDAGAPGAAIVIPPMPAPSGYYLVLRPGLIGKRRTGAPLVPYTLTASVEAGAPDLEVEPNDDVQHATLAQATATGWLAPAGDLDWYRVHVDAPSVLHVELSGAAHADLELAVYAAGSDGKPALLARANEGGPKETEVLPAVGLPAGDSYVLVQSAPRELAGRWVRDAADAEDPYRLVLDVSRDDGSVEREPNNDVKTAQVLTLPATVKGWIWPRKDVDVFRFHVAAGHAPVSFSLSAVRGVDLSLRLLEIHGDKAEVIGSSDSSRGEGEEKLLSVPLKEGDYGVEVASPRNKDASATQPYTLVVQ